MKASTSIIVVALAICVVAIIGYGAHSTARIHSLEQRLEETNQRLDAATERLQKVEAKLEARIELLGSNQR